MSSHIPLTKYTGSVSSEYQGLINRVRLIDPLAADYLASYEIRATPIVDFEESSDLETVMLWGNTPQGYNYWSGLAKNLAKLPGGEVMSEVPSAIEKRYECIEKRYEWRQLTDDGLLKVPEPSGPAYDVDDTVSRGCWPTEEAATVALEEFLSGMNLGVTA